MVIRIAKKASSFRNPYLSNKNIVAKSKESKKENCEIIDSIETLLCINFLISLFCLMNFILTYSEEGESVEDSDQDPAPQRDVLVGQQVQRNSCTYHFLNNNRCTNNSLPMKVQSNICTNHFLNNESLQKGNVKAVSVS